MIVSTIVCNMGRSEGNWSLLLSLFCRVSLFFVVEVPVRSDGMALAHEERDVELFSFVVGSGVAVYTRRGDVGLLEVVRHNMYAGMVRIMRLVGGHYDIAGVYVPP